MLGLGLSIPTIAVLRLAGGAPAPAAWTPAELGASLALWLDAEDTDSITLNGSTVSQWDDKSGNNYHVAQATAANQPAYGSRTLNGKNVVDFSGGKILFSTAGVFADNPDVMMAAVNLYDANLAVDDRALQIGSGVGGAYAISGGSQGYSSRYNNGNEVYGPTSLATPLMQVGTRPSGGDYAAAQMFINGTESAPTSSTSPTLVPNFNNGFSVGAGTSAALGTISSSVDGYIGEVVLVREITLATRQIVEGYLAWKWGLAANLPPDHPYRVDGSLFGFGTFDGLFIPAGSDLFVTSNGDVFIVQ
jgi:hypothetical protein